MYFFKKDATSIQSAFSDFFYNDHTNTFNQPIKNIYVPTDKKAKHNLTLIIECTQRIISVELLATEIFFFVGFHDFLAVAGAVG